MSYMAEATLEFFVEDSFMRITKEQEARIVTLLEPKRAEIETFMNNFDPESQSWRDQRNSYWGLLTDFDRAINAIVSDRRGPES